MVFSEVTDYDVQKELESQSKFTDQKPQSLHSFYLSSNIKVR